MFVFDFVTSMVLEEVWDWIYGCLVEALATLMNSITTMGMDVFSMPYIQAIVLLFTKFGWALYVVGLVVAVFEFAIEYQKGRVSPRDYFINFIKGFFAVSLFTVVPVRLYILCARLQYELTVGITGLSVTDGWDRGFFETLFDYVNGGENLFSMTPSNIVYNTFLLIAFAYCLIKVLFGNLKRAGIIVIQMAVGSMYMFSVPRGMMDGFRQWCKQVIALCLTTFLQNLVLTAGLMVFRENAWFGLGMLLCSAEVPRICGQFGMDTSTKVNVMGGVYAAQTAVNMGKQVVQVVGKSGGGATK